MLLNDAGQPNFALAAALFAAGVGLLLGGAANLVLRRGGRLARAGAAAGACAVAACGGWLAADSGRVAGLAAAGTAAALALTTVGPWLTSAAAAAARHPSARWGGLAGAGLATALGVVVWYELAFDAAVDRASDELAVLSDRPPTRPADARPTTDRGAPVVVMEATDPRARAELTAIEARVLDGSYARSVIRRQPADDRANCHGWVFTGGRYWVGGSEVDRILADNGYQAVTDPRPGDLIVYRSGGTVAHTAVVRYVTAGMPVLVEGKWGATGVYLHAAESSAYGTEFTFYRTDRASHVLAGIDAPTPIVAGGQ